MSLETKLEGPQSTTDPAPATTSSEEAQKRKRMALFNSYIRELVPDRSLVGICTCVIDRMVNISPLDKSPLTKFHTVLPVPLTPGKYFERLVRYIKPSTESTIRIIYQLNRLSGRVNIPDKNSTSWRGSHKRSSPPVNAMTVHRLLVGLFSLVNKYTDDFFYDNAYRAKAAGMDLKEFNELELLTLIELDHSLAISEDELREFYNTIADPGFHRLCRHTYQPTLFDEHEPDIGGSLDDPLPPEPEENEEAA